MQTEAFKLARETLRLAVKDYGWSRRPAVWHGESGTITRRPYRAALGKFEGEHWCATYYYRAMLDGDGDEPLMEGERCAGTPFEVSDLEREAFGMRQDTSFVVLWHSEQGFEALTEYTATEYDELRERYSEDDIGDADGGTFTRTAPSAWASYLINGDASGISEDDKAAADAFVAQYGMPVSCEEAGFIHAHDAYHLMPLGADCERYTFIGG